MNTYLIGRLGGLVDGNARSRTKNVTLGAQGAAELNGVGAVQASGAVVPALQRGVTEGSFGDGDSFSLASADASNELVAHAGTRSVADAKHGHDHIT